MSDYRFSVMDWHGINSLHAMIDHQVKAEWSAELVETHIPIEDIKISVERYHYQSILNIMERAIDALNKSTESEQGGIFLNAFDDITTICQSQLDKDK